jgi:DNA-binding winged helix-turn-helix (wHTH) protein/TolB-like protein
VVNSPRFRFGLFELDSDATELRRDGRVVSLQRQPRQVLAYLVRNASRTVSREELRKAVWGNQTFVDFERGLNFCISQIRSALRDDAASPIYVRTFARQGYRFIAPVESVASTPAAPQDHSAIASARYWPKVILPAILVLTGMGAGAAYLLRVVNASKRVPVVAIVRFDNETDDPANSKFSDGLTDNLVERLTSVAHGRYAVIGNSQLLRLPREQRNLAAISASLHANYVILGEVQSFRGQTRILAHLIHLPEQTHVKVVRLERGVKDPLEVEAEAAQTISEQFAGPMASGDTSPFHLAR